MTISNRISAITCTGDRPVCLSLSKQWMKDQIVKPMEWIIVDDGKTPLDEDIIDSLPDFATVLRREPSDDDPNHTMNINLEVALEYVEGDFIIFWEDDEYYSPEYLMVMAKHLEKYPVVGICKSRYYHLPSSRFFVHPNTEHASLAQTVMSVEHLKQFKELLDGDPFVDLRIWTKIVGVDIWKKKPFNLAGQVINNGKGFLFDDSFTKEYLYVGMKGMPGRSGIGSGHKGVGRFDANHALLKVWIKNQEHLDQYLKLQDVFIKYGRKTDLVLQKQNQIRGRKLKILQKIKGGQNGV